MGGKVGHPSLDQTVIEKSRLTQAKTCEAMTEDQLRAELSTLQSLIAKLLQAYPDRLETCLCVQVRIDETLKALVAKVDHNVQI